MTSRKLCFLVLVATACGRSPTPPDAASRTAAAPVPPELIPKPGWPPGAKPYVINWSAETWAEMRRRYPAMNLYEGCENICNFCICNTCDLTTMSNFVTAKLLKVTVTPHPRAWDDAIRGDDLTLEVEIYNGTNHAVVFGNLKFNYSLLEQPGDVQVLVYGHLARLWPSGTTNRTSAGGTWEMYDETVELAPGKTIRRTLVSTTEFYCWRLGAAESHHRPLAQRFAVVLGFVLAPFPKEHSITYEELAARQMFARFEVELPPVRGR